MINEIQNLLLKIETQIRPTYVFVFEQQTNFSFICPDVNQSDIVNHDV